MRPPKKSAAVFSRKHTAILFFISLFVSALLFAGSTSDERTVSGALPVKKDSIRSVEAFKKVYSVLLSPRCVNCHPIGDVPLQGDDSHLHAMFPKRGPDGKGILTMKCTNCHQPENTPGLQAPPGNSTWHLPPADMKMVFEGKSPRELAQQLIDPEQNGHKNMQDLIEHADDALVLWGWNPGEGRTVPPLTHAEFKEAWITWIETGAYAPAN